MRKIVHDWIDECIKRNGKDFTGPILDIGSYDINGTAKPQLSPFGEYTGVDFRAGPNVDEVSYGHEFEGEPGGYGLVCSFETLEHDSFAFEDRGTVDNMIRLTRPGGFIIITAAGLGNKPHHPETSSVPGHYENICHMELTRFCEEWSVFTLAMKWDAKGAFYFGRNGWSP